LLLLRAVGDIACTHGLYCNPTSHFLQFGLSLLPPRLLDDQIRELVSKLHSARMAGTNEPFRTDWFDRSASLKKQAAQRSKRMPVISGAMV
jgi:hypothetical protein